MTNTEIHFAKYKMFKKDAENQENSEPTRIEAYFEATFHLIESVAAKQMIHIDKHQNVRKVLEENKGLFGSKTEDVWRAFQKIENQIRPGQIYGGAINGEKLKQTKQLFEIIESSCKEVLGNTI